MTELDIRYGCSFPTMCGSTWFDVPQFRRVEDVGYSPEDWLYDHWSCLSVCFTPLWGYLAAARHRRVRIKGNFVWGAMNNF